MEIQQNKETLGTNQMEKLETKTSNTVLEISYSFNWLISRLSTAEKHSVSTKIPAGFYIEINKLILKLYRMPEEIE